MSQWTHVAGIIRYDGLFDLGMKEPDLGNTCDFDSPESEWDACDVPCGSEGGLTLEMWKNPNTSHMAARTASIFGDLRDYDNAEEIIEYFNRITDGYMIRDACFVINVESQPLRTFVYVDERDDKGEGFMGFKEALLP